MIRVIVADDHQIFAEGIVELLSKTDDVEVVGIAYDGEEALNLVEKGNVDIAILDINMPKLSGVEVTQQIRANKLETKTLILSMYNDMEFIDLLLEAECDGYIVKNKGYEELITALRTIQGGKRHFGSMITDTILADRAKKKVVATGIDPNLTKREIEVLKLIAREYTSKEIGDELNITEKTANTHRRNLISKLGVRNSIGLANYAHKHGLMD